MASNRHLGRIVALQTLYEYDFRIDCNDKDPSIDEILERNLSRYSETIDDKDFIASVVSGVMDNQEKLDGILQPLAPEWPLSQIARIDRAILRIGLYELDFENDVPPKVVINEAVELAKSFGSDNSSKFINGVLGTALRNKENTKTPPKKSKKGD
jgi:N utilization substance protein B